MKTLKVLVLLAVLGGLGLLGFLYSGFYPIGADVEHRRLTYWALETMRERSIARNSADLVVPPLDDPEQLLAGGADYNDMCAGCHLKPGKTQSELSQGLYPRPPNLSLASAEDPHGVNPHLARSAARQFWIIKHGIKASGMAAWGQTHDDARIWSMVAFLQKLPTLTPDQYQILTARAGGEAMEHDGMEGMEMGQVPAASATPATQGTSEPTAIVDQFQKALSAGDTATAAGLLAPDVKIYESGFIERSKAEYAAHHLPADAEFLKSATVELLSRTGDAVGDLAWVASESHLTTRGKDKPTDVVSTETMVLKKTTAGWRIVHIHWSSRPNKSA